MSDVSRNSVTIQSSPANVWRALTDLSLMPRWMSEPGAEMSIATEWKVGGSIIMQGRWHKMRYKNVGMVLQFDPNRTLSYSHLSSLSRIPDVPENHATITFRLTADKENTLLELDLGNFPTYEIRRHLEFYWNITLGILKNFIEETAAGTPPVA